MAQLQGALLLSNLARLAVLLSLAVAAPRTAAVTVPIFQADRIGFTSGQSRDIRRTVTFPTFGANDRVRLDWDVLADRDPWDRSGSIHAILPGGEQVQLGKFITGFNGTTQHDEDLSDLAPLLSGKTLTVEAHIDTWVVDAWRISAEVVVEPGARQEPNPLWAAPVIPRDPDFGWHESGDVRGAYSVLVPQQMTDVKLKYFTSGHHHNQTSASDEFNRRRHRLYVDGVQVWTGVPWRTDGPDFRSVNPTSGRWDGNRDGDTTDPYPIDYWSSDFPRSGWVPGDEVHPYEIDVTPWLGGAGLHEVELLIEGVDINSYWRVSAYVSGTPTGPAPLAGDFNADGLVDAADYTVWRDLAGQSGAGLAADANGDGTVDVNDYERWRDNYGAASPAVSVPEGASATLALWAATLTGARRTRRRRT